MAAFVYMEVVFHFKWYASLLAAVTLGLSLVTVFKFRAAPNKNGRKAIEGMTALYVLVCYLTLILSFQFR